MRNLIIYLIFIWLKCSQTYFLRCLPSVAKLTHFMSLKEDDRKNLVSNGLNDIIDAYDVFLIDQWGVLHDGSKAYDGVMEALNQMHAKDKKMILLSNSSKRLTSSSKGLRRIGFDPSIFHAIVTSGELAWNAINNRELNDLNIPSTSPLRVFIIGNGDDDYEYMESCNCVPTVPEDADFIIARGTFSVVVDNPSKDGTHSKIYKSSAEFVENISPWLDRCAKRNLPMIVSNPDMFRPGTNDIMPGQIARSYQYLNPLAKIKYFGKPYSTVYEHCIMSLKDFDVNPQRVCGIGDSLEHDVLGARNAGFDSVWIMNGVHCLDLGTHEGSSNIPDNNKIQALHRKFDIQPSYSIPRFNL